MKKTSVSRLGAAIAGAGMIAAMLGGCVAYVPEQGPGYGPGYGHGQGPHYRGGRDRDGDGVPNRYDARPDNPRRY